MQESDPRGAGMAHKAVLINIEIEGKLLGELGQHTQNTTVQNLVIAPEYLRLRQLLLGALRPYPQARAAVLAALRSVESVSDPDEPKQLEVLSDPTIATGDRPER